MCLENLSIFIHDLLKFTISRIDKLSSYSLDICSETGFH